MSQETILPEQWQELPQVKSLVEEAVREARAPLSTLTKERDGLQRQLRELQTELQGLHDTAQSTQSKENGSEKKPASDFPQQERQRLESLSKQLRERVASLEDELQAKDRRLAEEILARGIRDAVAKVGEVHKDAWADVVSRGKTAFSLDEQGRPVARDAAGEVIYSKDGITPMGFDEWAQKLLVEAPHLFKASSGAGSGAAGGTGQEQPGREVVLTKEQARNPLAYRRAKERAAKLGVELIIQ